MNRNHLALFHAVAETGSITSAAARLRISQPAVSKQIIELEQALEIRLLERLPRGVRLTEAGMLLAEYASRQDATEREAVRALKEFRGLKRGRLAVGASTTIASYLLPPVFGEFHRRHPDIELRLDIANTRDIQRFLMQGMIEVGLTEGVIQTEDLESRVFHQDELVAIAPPGHHLVRKKPVTAREFCREPFILREEGSGTREVVLRALSQKGIEIEPIMSLASTEAIKRTVAAGIGVAIVSGLAISLESRFGLLATISIKDLVIHRPLHLQKRHGKDHGLAMKEFLKILGSSKNER